MSARPDKQGRMEPQKTIAAQKELCAKISPEQARQRKLEQIERQLHYLIGQIRELKTT